MKTFQELYESMVTSALQGHEDAVPPADAYQPEHLEYLLNPKKYPLVLKTGVCNCTGDKVEECIQRCPFDAIQKAENGGIIINETLCLGCSACVEGCASSKLRETTDMIPALKAIRAAEGPVYAMIAPAFLGQFSHEVTPGKLRTALKKIGFDSMVEVALFADVLTLKEALEFDKNICTESDFQLTSCCCPMWIAMIKKVYHQLLPHVPGAVSPMIACARAIKLLHPDALTVFIGPCLAKKAEAREKDLVGDVDFVLTFQEMQNILDALGINPAELAADENDHSSRAGRIYARAGGVSEAVAKTVERLNPNREIQVRTKQADGVPDCKAMMQELLSDKADANFFEGMGCRGGCVGGPKAVLGVPEGTELVEAYGNDAPYQTPAENPYVIELLHRLGIDTIETLLEDTDIFTRHFE